MCGRFSQSKIARESVRAFGLPVGPAPRPETWNLSPTTSALVVRDPGTGLAGDWLTWGLAVRVPGMKPINARVETAGTKPLFRDSWKSRRCVVPADGWYEWKAEAGIKQPYFFHRRDREPIFFAGLWLEESFALLTTAADGDLGEIHDRRPVALQVKDSLPWIEAGAAAPGELISPQVPADEIEFYPVSRRVSRAGEEGSDLILPLPEKGSNDLTLPFLGV